MLSVRLGIETATTKTTAEDRIRRAIRDGASRECDGNGRACGGGKRRPLIDSPEEEYSPIDGGYDERCARLTSQADEFLRHDPERVILRREDAPLGCAGQPLTPYEEEPYPIAAYLLAASLEDCDSPSERLIRRAAEEAEEAAAVYPIALDETPEEERRLRLLATNRWARS